MSMIDKVRMEEKTNYLKQQYDELRQQMTKISEEFDKKVNDKQMEIWKQDMSIRSLSQQILQISQENERLRKCKDLSESIARLPSVCLEDLTNEEAISNAKESALMGALESVKSTKYEGLVKEIEDMQNK